MNRDSNLGSLSFLASMNMANLSGINRE